MLSKRFNIRMLVSAAVLVMTLWVSAFAALKSGSWSLNPADFRYDMSLYFRLADRSLEDMEAYEIAAFSDDECCGVAEMLPLTGGESCLYMRIRSNAAQGARIEFRMRPKGSDSYVVLRPEDGADFLFKSNDRVGMPSTPFVLARWFNVEITADHCSIDFTSGLYKEGTRLSVTAGAPEGFRFIQWSDGSTDPTRTFTVDADVSLTAFFDVQYYEIQFRIGDDVLAAESIACGSEISAPEPPAKEGYSFSGWSGCPETMPAHNVEVTGEYSVNTYSVTYQVDEEVMEVRYYEFGAPIIAPVMPEKEGHTFSGWGDVPAVMPAFDLVLGGTYADNYYTVTFRVEGVVIFTDDVAYESPIVAPEVPEKEGCSFSGWGDVPAVMPASDLSFDGSYVLNHYRLTFRAGDEIVSEVDMLYGAEIVAPDAPVREGHSFAGWGVVPPVMPASDLEIIGIYDVNIYSLTFDIDGEVYSNVNLPYGEAIVVPEDVPAKDGHVFMGWGDVPSTMPAYDIVVSGTYAANHYTLTFRIGDEILFTGEQPFGSVIVVPEVPEKDGYVFSGWGDVPGTMPASNTEISGSYDPLSYSLVFRIADEVISSSKVVYGAEIVLPEAPVKEGHSFDGWGVVPALMPARDLEFSGSYSVNQYRLVVYLNDDVYMENVLAFGAVVEVSEPVLGEDKVFDGWSEEIPSVMPAHDVVIHGVVTDKLSVSVPSLLGDAESTVYSADGVLLFKGGDASRIIDRLTPGVYIVNGKKMIVR